MGHIINYIETPANDKHAKERVLGDIREEVMHEDWQEGGCYHGNLTWHSNKVYETYEDAKDAIERYDNGWYSDHAVMYKRVDKIKKTKQMENIERRIGETQEKWDKMLEDNHVRHHKSKNVGCKGCGSSINKDYVKSANKCPVCGGSLYSETVRKRAEEYRAKITSLRKQLKELEKKQAAKAKGNVYWLVKYEYHV